jgi:hypothetical protein
VEEKLAAICRELLALGRLGIHDNFFELGGHSLLALQLLSRANGVFRVEVPVRSFFESPTVASLARIIEEGRFSTGHAASKIEAARRGDRGLDELLAELEQLSEEDVQALLEQEDV